MIWISTDNVGYCTVCTEHGLHLDSGCVCCIDMEFAVCSTILSDANVLRTISFVSIDRSIYPSISSHPIRLSTISHPIHPFIHLFHSTYPSHIPHPSISIHSSIPCHPSIFASIHLSHPTTMSHHSVPSPIQSLSLIHI